MSILQQQVRGKGDEAPAVRREVDGRESRPRALNVGRLTGRRSFRRSAKPVLARRGRRLWRWVAALVMLGAAVALGVGLADHTTQSNSVVQDKEFAAQERQLLALQEREATAAAVEKAANARAKAVAARRALTLRRQEAAAIAAMEQQATHGLQMLQSLGFTPDTLCAPIATNGTGPEQRQAARATERRRNQILDYLNLSCP